MQTPTRSKVCLVSATTLVLGAWLGGNPFLQPPGAGCAADGGPTTGADRDAAGPVAAVLEACPDASLRDAVLHVMRDDRGDPIWALRDGRFAVRNPVVGPGQPAVLFVAAPQGKAPEAALGAGKAVPALWQRPTAAKPEGE